MSLLDLAKQYRDAGITVIGSNIKGCLSKWKKYQDVKPTDEELTAWFSGRFSRIAVICGRASGNLEVIDVDVKHDVTGTLWDNLLNKLLDYYKGQLPFAMVRTPSGGMHLYYRCEVIGGNPPLARVEIAPRNIKAIIEMRADGGLVMAPPSEGYTALSPGFPNNIPVISAEEREDIHEICRSFNTYIPPVREIRTRTSNNYKQTPWGEYNESEEWQQVLEEAGWKFSHTSESWDYYTRPDKETGVSASFNRETRQFYCFTSSTVFEPNVGLRPFDIYKELKADGDFKRACSEIAAMGYGQLYSQQQEDVLSKSTHMLFEGYEPLDINEMLKLDFDALERTDKSVPREKLIEVAVQRNEDAKNQFWVQDDKGNLKLDRASLGDFLEKRGYRLLVDSPDSKSFRIIRINYKRRWAYDVPLDVFKKEVELWAKTEGPEITNVSSRKIRNLVRSVSKDAWNSTLDLLPRVIYDNINFLKKASDEETEWFAFRNTVLKVSKYGYEPIAYDALPKDMLVWKKDIKQFDFHVSDIELESEFNESPIWLFFKRISGIDKTLQHLEHQKELQAKHPVLYTRFFALITTIGYLLASYKDPDQPYCPIFEEDTETSAQGGGTGKGLIFEIIGSLRNVVNIDCKIWDIKQSFPFEAVNLDTDIVHFEDTEPNFKISQLNNIITRGFTINNKYEKSFQISYKFSPKCAISTNYKVQDDADHESRRQKKIYLHRYFHKNYKPKEELGMIFGKEWSEEDYQLCYNILFYCLHVYLALGIIDAVPTENVNRKYIEDEFREPFLKFMDSYVSENLDVWVKKETIMQAFFDRTGEKEKYWSATRFKKALQAYAQRIGYDVEIFENNSRSIGERHKEYCIFTLKESVRPEFTSHFVKTVF